MVKKSKVQKKNMQLAVFGTIIVMLVIGLSIFGIRNAMSVGQTGEAQDIVISQAVSDGSFCANNPTVDLKLRIQDALSLNEVDYINGSTIYLKDLETNSITEHTITGDHSFTTLADALKCTNTKGYEIYGKATGEFNSFGRITIEATALKQDPVEIDFKATGYSLYKVKGYDNEARENIKQTSDNSTDYVSSATSIFQASTGSAFTGTADELIDIEFLIKPVTIDEAKGFSSMYIVLNTEDESNLADWDESQVFLYLDGKQLTEATGLSENELRALSSYEKLYKVDQVVGMIGEIKDPDMKLRIQLLSESGQASDFDPVIKIVALGDFQSVKDASVILQNVGFKDDSSRTELFTAQTITINVG